MSLAAELVLPPDVLIIPVTQLSTEAREHLDPDGEFAITRPRGRSTSSLVDAAFAELLDEFRQPSTVVAAVLRYSRRNVVDPETTLDGAYPVLRRCVADGFLVTPGSASDEVIDATLQMGDQFADTTVVRCVQVLDDTEVYQVARASGGLAALKLARRSADERTAELFEREAAALGRLTGAPVPTLLEVGETNGRPWLLIEWCDGVAATRAASAIRHAADGHAPASASASASAALLELGAAIAGAYAAIHDRGIVHGDVHPGNVLVDASGSVRIIDFGLARVVDDPTEHSHRGGVSAYFEPEYAQAAIDHRRPPQATTAGEIHAVAALVYHVVCGTTYLDFGLDAAESMRRIAEEPPLPFTSRGIAAWPSLETVLQRALTKDPGARPRSMTIFADLLGGVSPVPIASEPRHTARLVGDSSTHVAFTDRVIAGVMPGTPLHTNGLDEPRASITYGSAGIAVALLQIAKQRDDAGLLSLADEWAVRAGRDARGPGAFTSDALGIDEALIGDISPYHRLSGVYLVEALVAHAAEDVIARQHAVDGFVAESCRPCTSLDLTLGRSGTLLATTQLFATTNGAKYASTSGLRELGTRTLAGIWDEVDVMGDIATTTALPHLGVAHGWAGILLATLRWCETTGTELPGRFTDRLDQLAAMAEPAGPGIRWRWTNGTPDQSGSTSTMPGWCNGTAGHVHLWTAAHRHFGDERSLTLAERAGHDVHHSRAGIAHLCCGTSGQAYALLDLYRHTGDDQWLSAARTVGLRAIADAANPRPGSLITGSLYKGEMGVAALAADLERPSHASMPIFGITD
ncbi:MAG: lanthionine synthetase LanC family protein [Ilumatobacteraceae bacterium]